MGSIDVFVTRTGTMNLAGQRVSPVYALGVRKCWTGGTPILPSGSWEGIELLRWSVRDGWTDQRTRFGFTMRLSRYA